MNRRAFLRTLAGAAVAAPIAAAVGPRIAPYYECGFDPLRNTFAYSNATTGDLTLESLMEALKIVERMMDERGERMVLEPTRYYAPAWFYAPYHLYPKDSQLSFGHKPAAVEREPQHGDLRAQVRDHEFGEGELLARCPEIPE